MDEEASGRPTGSRRTLRWAWLGRVAYAPAAEVQEQLRRAIRFEDGDEHFLALEHPPVFTLGRNASRDDILAADLWMQERRVEIHVTNRGGQATYHGPGQLVGYPVVNLDPDRRDVRRYVHDLQEVIVRTLADYGIEGRGRTDQAYIGVWVGEEKIASIGVHLARWITNHGFALNVATDLRHFEGIVACGLPGVRMTSMARLIGTPPPLAEIAARAATHLAEIFDRTLGLIPSDAAWREALAEGS